MCPSEIVPHPPTCRSYTDSSFYTLIGSKFCLLFNIMYAKTGTETVAESFYHVVGKQKMEGGQSLEVLASQSKIDLVSSSHYAV